MLHPRHSPRPSFEEHELEDAADNIKITTPQASHPESDETVMQGRDQTEGEGEALLRPRTTPGE